MGEAGENFGNVHRSPTTKYFKNRLERFKKKKAKSRERVKRIKNKQIKGGVGGGGGGEEWSPTIVERYSQDVKNGRFTQRKYTM